MNKQSSESPQKEMAQKDQLKMDLAKYYNLVR